MHRYKVLLVPQAQRQAQDRPVLRLVRPDAVGEALARVGVGVEGNTVGIGPGGEIALHGRHRPAVQRTPRRIVVQEMVRERREEHRLPAPLGAKDGHADAFLARNRLPNAPVDTFVGHGKSRALYMILPPAARLDGGKRN